VSGAMVSNLGSRTQRSSLMGQASGGVIFDAESDMRISSFASSEINREADDGGSTRCD
jgi:hypothetical protein